MKIKNNKKTVNKKNGIGLLLIGITLFSILLLNLVLANENFNETKRLIDSGISCSKLTNKQLEEMGDYYMEQMHPGEAHELMHRMMGGEDSETVKLMHINMARNIYCGETSSGMMGMMNMISRSGIMGSGGGMMYGNMMGNYYNPSIYSLLSLLLLIGLVVLVILIIIKLVRDLQRKK